MRQHVADKNNVFKRCLKASPELATAGSLKCSGKYSAPTGCPQRKPSGEFA